MEVKRPDQYSAFLRGSISGILVVAVLQPFDVVKTVQQASSKMKPQEAIKIVIKENGYTGLWTRGLAPTLVRGALGPGLYFQLIEMTNGWFPKTKTWDFIQGSTARAMGAVLVSPFSVLKARIEWNPKSSRSFKGFRDMFVGLGPTLARDVPFSGLYVLFYRGIKPDHDQNSSAASQFGIDLTAGLIAGALATGLTHPFDVMKTRAQLGIPMFEGNLWSGLTMRLAKRPMSTALTWAFFEFVSSFPVEPH